MWRYWSNDGILQVKMKKVVVIASGEGSNFSAIVKSGITVDRVITDNPTANVIRRAEKVNVPVVVVAKKEEYTQKPDNRRSAYIDENIPEDTGLIVLAGYCRILAPWFCKKWEGKIINVHPSLLPAFAGTMHAIEETWNYGCKVFGVTIHWVTTEVDAGKIIAQKCIHLQEDDTLETITAKIHTLEWFLYPEAIRKLL